MPQLLSSRRNRIDALQNNEGMWVEDREQLKSMAFNFYAELFRSDPLSWGLFELGCFPIIEEAKEASSKGSSQKRR